MQETSEERQIATALLEIGAVQFKPAAPIRFKSGILSPVYVDNRRLIFHPTQWHLVIEGFRRLIEREALVFDVVVGVAVGGVPHSSALAYMLEKPSVFVRQTSKAHGTQKLVEGGEVNGLTALLVEDLVTTGGSSLQAVGHLRADGATVTDVLAIVSYGFEESRQAFADAKVGLQTLTSFDAIMDVAREQARYTADEIEIIKHWFRDPFGWEKDILSHD